MKVIFLDIDGVLNNDTTKEHLEPVEDGYVEHMDYQPGWSMGLDHRLVPLINPLVRPGIEWVLSSTWHLHFDLEEMNTMLQEKGFTGELTSITPYKMSNFWRGNEIGWWMRDRLTDNRKEAVDNFVILDDMDCMAPYDDKLVLTDPHTGITPTDVETAVKMLNLDEDEDA